MKAAVFNAQKDVQLKNVDEPQIQKPDEAIVKVTYSCICGSDLWFFRGIQDRDQGSRVGHEFIGIVEEVGTDIKNLQPGDVVIAPFTSADGTCPECKVGMSSACRSLQAWGADGYDGGQSQKVRVPTAEGTLFKVPKESATEDMMPKLLPLTDVLSTGHHAAVSAHVSEGKTVAVIGDGAVGLCGVAACKRLGAGRIILLSTHQDRAEIGKKFGATDIVAARGDDAIKQVKALTDDLGVDCVLESVGMKGSWDTAFGIVRAGGNIGFVGVPADPEINDVKLSDLFWKNIGIQGGIAPAATYIPELLQDVLSGSLDVSAIFTMTLPLDEIQKGYKAMDERNAVKVMLHPIED